MNALFLLLRDHFELSGLLRKYVQASLPEQAEALEALRQLWETHIRAAEVFYAANKRWAADAERRAAEQHQAVAAVIAELAVLDVTQSGRAERLAALRDLMARHVNEEQQGVFAEAKKLVDAETLLDLGRRIEEMRTAEVEAAREEVPPARLMEAVADVAQALSDALHSALDLPARPPQRPSGARSRRPRPGKRTAPHSRRRP